ncbi:hypothetical protein LTR28_004156 [Elasticomyces elasticus]|nr:hypothetical protein LTR28_004156 [Elasticomyces elasticus]
MPIAREQTPDPTAMMIDPPAPLTPGRKDGNSKGGGGASKTLKAPAKRGLDSPATNDETESQRRPRRARLLVCVNQARSKTRKPPIDVVWDSPTFQTPKHEIPRTIDECDEADRTLIAMKDSGKPWADIRAAWELITGEKTGASTLPNRYLRLKANLAVVKEEDSLRLLEAKSLVEKTYENEKWTLIADQVKEMGGDR